MHVGKLEEAGLVRIKITSGKRGTMKIVRAVLPEGGLAGCIQHSRWKTREYLPETGLEKKKLWGRQKNR